MSPYQEYLQSDWWQARRLYELDRARHCCEFCGDQFSPLHVHHLSYRHIGYEQPEDLIVLCEGCHQDSHEFSHIDDKGHSRSPLAGVRNSDDMARADLHSCHGAGRMTTIHTTLKRVEIRRSGALRQKWRAVFIASNNLTLAKTSEHYHNLGDLKAMLAKYFPDWPVTVQGRKP